MKEIEKKIMAYFKLKGKEDTYEISLHLLDTYLVLQHKEKEYIGANLQQKIEEMISEGLVKKTTGSKVALTPKGITKL